MDLEQALAIEDQTERMLTVVAVIAEAVSDLDFTPAVVGGLAVQFWTYGEYTTYDIDLLLPSTPDVDERLLAIGFVRDGRHWVLPDRDVFVEAPGSFVEGLSTALTELNRLAERIEKGERIETWDLHDIARKLKERRYDHGDGA